jgi:hypothetical protein
MWKPALKIDYYKMCENQCFETQVKLFFANFLNPTQIFKRWLFL